MRFYIVYFIVDIFVDTAQKFQAWNQYALIEVGLFVIFFVITAWFSWRFYTGMFRGFDFYQED